MSATKISVENPRRIPRIDDSRDALGSLGILGFACSIRKD